MVDAKRTAQEISRDGTTSKEATVDFSTLNS